MSPIDPAAGRRSLFARLRAALTLPLTQGSWSDIEKDHAKVELPWRVDLQPGWGKPKYVEPVLAQLPDEDVVAVARRVVERLTDRRVVAVEDALSWIDADGVAQVTEVTRLALAQALDGWRIHPDKLPKDVLEPFADGNPSSRSTPRRWPPIVSSLP